MNWTTIDENGNVQELTPKDINYGFDRMLSIENYTNYEFSTSDKVGALTNEVIDEAKSTGTAINDVLGNIGNGLKNASVLIKYAPFIIGAYYLYKLDKEGAIFGK